MFKSLTTLIVSAAAVTALALAGGPGAASAATASARTPECAAGQLSPRISTPPGGGAAGNRYATLTLTNSSRTACDTGGWVGLGLETATGRLVDTHAIRTDRTQAELIYLRPHRKVTSQLHWSDVDSSTDKPGGPCFVAPHRILVTPPNARVSLSLSWTRGIVCGAGTIDITPLAPGEV